MGLFDNLFLDQNTPITINDGFDHSKDVVTPVVDPSENSAPGAPHRGSKNDNSISDLFASDKKEEAAADVTLNPEAPTDIALEIGSAPTNESAIAPADPSMAPADFDIGGDLSFDTLPASTVISDASAPDITEVVADPIGLSLPGIGDPPPAELSGTFLTGGSEPGGEKPTDGTPPAVQEEAKAEATPTETPAAPTEAPAAPGALGGGGGIFGLIDGNNDTTAPAIEGAPTPGVVGSTIAEPSKTELASGVAPGLDMTPRSGAFSNMGNMSAEAILGRDALALFSQGGQTSSLLRDKLNNFIEELKVLHSRDQSQRYHKLEQIAMYEERIREIDAEAANRKRVLQAEIDDLKRQIEMMDREKNDIQDVISTFHKEVGVN